MDYQDSAKYWFIKTALSYLGTPYCWGGDDPSGFDCSGFVVECLKSIGWIESSSDYSAHQLLVELDYPKLDQPRPGALLFLVDANNQAKHVIICLDEFFGISASGGNPNTDGTEAAWRDNAWIRIRPLPSGDSIALRYPFAQKSEPPDGHRMARTGNRVPKGQGLC